MKTRNIVELLVTVLLVASPLLAVAQSGVNTGTGLPGVNTGTPLPVSPTQPSYTSSPTGGQFSVQNPLQVTSFCSLVKLILQALLVIGIPVAVLFIVFAGFKFVWARGNPQELELARANLFYTIIGIAIFLGAWLIATVIVATLQQLGVTGLSSC